MEQCESTLESLVAANSGVEGAMIVRRDGIPAISQGRSVDAEVLGAMAAAAAGAADVCTQTVGSGDPDVIQLCTTGACVSIASLDAEYILVAFSPTPKQFATADKALLAARGDLRKRLAGS